MLAALLVLIIDYSLRFIYLSTYLLSKFYSFISYSVLFSRTSIGILLSLLILQSIAFAQNLSDSLVIRNYGSSNYLASSANYTGLVLPSNEILIANDRGLLSYDGVEWKLTTIKDDSKVISMLYQDSLLFVGGDDEFGYLKKTDEGKYHYTSLREQFKDTLRLNEFFQVIRVKSDIYFQSYEQIFRWDGNSLHSINITDSHIFNINNNLVASKFGEGLFGVKDDKPYPLNTKFKFDEDVAYSIIKTSKPNKFLICTYNHGIYALNSNDYSTVPLPSEASKLLKKYGFYYGTNWLDSLYAATTWDGEVIIFNEKGIVKKLIDKSTGITGKYLRELFIDNRNKIWITSDVGLSEIYWPQYDPTDHIKTVISRVSLNGKTLPIRQLSDTLAKENANIKLVFTTPGFDKEEVFYSYKLGDLSDKWSKWSTENSKEYSQLEGGSYTFYVKSKTTNGLESSVASINISVLTPWFKMPWAYLLYVLIFAGLISIVVWARTLRFRITNQRLEAVINERTKEIIEKSKELASANENLKVKNQELDNFVYRSSHDLIAPLKSLKGLIYIARSDNPGNNQSKYLKHMEDSVLKLEDFIKSILDFTTNIKTETTLQEVNIDELINDIIYELKYYDKTDKIELRKLLTIPSLITDAKRLKIILSNLMTNAIKYHNYSIENPYLEIASFSKDEKVAIEVRDNGQGIKQEFINKIFDMFFRASSNSEGSGLGLYIVKDTVDKLGGSIEVSSSFGEGTTFTILLNKNGSY